MHNTSICVGVTNRRVLQKVQLYNTNGYCYSKVCGRALGYRYGYTNAFDQGITAPSINDIYVEGLSITQGTNPRNHIWTYASGHSETCSSFYGSCPCIGGGMDASPRRLWATIMEHNEYNHPSSSPFEVF